MFLFSFKIVLISNISSLDRTLDDTLPDTVAIIQRRVCSPLVNRHVRQILDQFSV